MEYCIVLEGAYESKFVGQLLPGSSNSIKAKVVFACTLKTLIANLVYSKISPVAPITKSYGSTLDPNAFHEGSLALFWLLFIILLLQRLQLTVTSEITFSTPSPWPNPSTQTVLLLFVETLIALMFSLYSISFA